MLSDGVTPSHYQRRIGNRYPVRVQVNWRPWGSGRWLRRTRDHQSVTDNMSLTGLGFEAPTQPGVGRGSPITVAISDKICTAAVRQARPGRRPGDSYYGVEIRDPAMIDEMQQLIAGYQRRRASADPGAGSTDGGTGPHPSLRPSLDD